MRLNMGRERTRARQFESTICEPQSSSFTKSQIQVKDSRSNHLPHAAVSNEPNVPDQHCEVREKLGLRPGGFGIPVSRHLVDE